MYHELRIRFKTAEELKLVKKAAKADDRSVSQFVARAALKSASEKLASPPEAA